MRHSGVAYTCATDEKFLQLAAKEQDQAPAGVSNWHWNLSVVLTAAKQAWSIPGDFVELGVYKGHTTKFLADYLGFADWPKRWWLFDTFEGVPADQADPGREGMTADVYGEAFSFEEVRDRFAPYGNIQVVKGRVPEVFADRCPEAISFSTSSIRRVFWLGRWVRPRRVCTWAAWGASLTRLR